MKALLKDALVGLALALVVIVLMLFAAYNSSIIYRRF